MQLDIRRIYLLFSILLLGVATAQQPVTLELENWLVTTEATDDGPVERFQAALEAAPGDLVEWRLLAVNTGDELLTGVALTIPLLPQTRYLPGTAVFRYVAIDAAVADSNVPAEGADALFSSDGGQTFQLPPLTRTVIETRDGEQIEVVQIIDPSEYTHARVVVPTLEPGSRYTFSLRTEVR